MIQKTDLSKLYDTLLSVPGMNETVKIDLKLPRKNILLLNKIIERGIHSSGGEKEDTSIIEAIPDGILQELKEVADDLLHRSGLSEMNEKLKAFN